MQVLRGQPRGADAALDDDHVAHGRRSVRGARARRLAQRHHLLPLAGAHVHDVHIVGGAGQADA